MNRAPEDYTDSAVDEQARLHTEALRRASARNAPLGAGASTVISTDPTPTDSLRATEALGSRGTSDATLNWANGEHVASKGWGDDRDLPATSAGVSAETIRATPPDDLGRPVIPTASGTDPGELSGVDAIAGATQLSNPNAVRERR